MKDLATLPHRVAGEEKDVRVHRSLEQIQQEGPQWQDRTRREPVGPERWGKDHWFLFSVVDERTVNWHGQMDWNLIQVSQRHWPMLWAARVYGKSDPKDGADYGLRLKPGDDGRAPLLEGHCQVDALMDLLDAGLITLSMPARSPSGRSYLRPDGHALSSPSPRDPVTGHVEWLLMPWVKVTLTERGWQVSAALRRHKGDGGLFAEFEMPKELEEA